MKEEINTCQASVLSGAWPPSHSHQQHTTLLRAAMSMREYLVSILIRMSCSMAVNTRGLEARLCDILISLRTQITVRYMAASLLWITADHQAASAHSVFNSDGAASATERTAAHPISGTPRRSE